MRFRRWIAASSLASLLAVSSAEADEAAVLLEVSPSAREQASRYVSQLKLELQAGRFELRETPEKPTTAVVRVNLEGGEVLARVIVPLDDGYIVRDVRLNTGESNGPFVFAMKVRELLHGTMLDLEGAKGLQRSSQPIDEAAFRRFEGNSEPLGTQQASPSFSVFLGPSVSIGSGGIPVGFAPALAFSVRATESIHVEVLGVGPATARVDDVTGGADLDQEVAALRLRLEPWNRGPGAPFVSLGAGVHSMGVRGRAEGPFEAETGRTLSGAGLVGVGYRYDFVGAIGIQAEVCAVPLSSPPTIEFDGRRELSLGNPLVLGLLGIRMGF